MQGSPMLSDEEELMHFRTVAATFVNYRIDSLRDILIFNENSAKNTL